jgi:ABC-type nitrate/sulfonate/bicarbonate transport system substrate-binding protein
MLKQFSLARGDVTIAQIGGSGQRFAALSAGRVQVAPMIEPGITLAADKGFNPILDLAAAKTPWIFDGVVVTNDYLRKDIGTLTRFVRAYIAGARLALADPVKAKELIAQRFKTRDTKVIDATYADFVRLMPRDAAPSTEGATNVIAQLEAIGISVGSRNVNDYLDLGLIAKLKQDGFLAEMDKAYPVK